MLNKYIAFDVETPNHFNNKMSAIGITVIENGVITEDLYFLVNPETEFDRFNVELTGITPEMVKNEGNFYDLWQRIEPIMSSGILVAHNAPFDMGVLSKCLKFYRICWKPVAHYLCTCKMGKMCYPDLPNHRLNTMCDFLNISLDHHNAASDSHACAELFVDYIDHKTAINPFLRCYDIENSRTLKEKVAF